MKFSVLQQNLQNGLKVVQKAVPSKPQLPILGSILISSKNNTLTISATDLYFGVQSEIPASIDVEGTCAVPGKLFAEAIFSLNSGKLKIEFIDQSLVFTSDTGANFKIPAQSEEEYPDFPEQQGMQHEISLKNLKEIDSFVRFSAATDQARLTLTTVLLEPTVIENSQNNTDAEKKHTLAVATDGFRLSILTIPELNTLEKSALIPAKALSEVARMADQLNQEKVSCSFSESLKQVFFKVDKTSFYARLVDGDFPPYQKIIPATFLTEVNIDADHLLQQLKQASIFARDISNVVQFRLQPESAELEITARGSQGSYSSSMPVEILKDEGGEPLNHEIAFNVKYVLEFLQAQPDSHVWFGMSESLKPALFKPKDQDQLQYIVMPFRMNG